MSNLASPFSLPFDLATLSERGAELVVAPNPAERASIADWLGVPSVERLDATIRLKRAGDDAYEYAADFSADVVQSCVVTLDSVPAHLEGQVTREYRIMAKLPLKGRHLAPTGDLPAADEDTEFLSTSAVDLAAPLLEELSLSLDPYPRAPGVVFEAPPQERKPADSPFAVLAKLKERAEPGPSPTTKGKTKPKS